jgi:hypothetical protein
MLKALAARYGGDPACVDLHRLLRMPGFHNLKYPEKPETKLLEHRIGDERNEPCDFNISVEAPKARPVAADEEKIADIVDRFTTNAEKAGLELGIEQEHANGGVKWVIECPWADGHTQSGSTAAVFVMSDGSIQFNCFHNHCAARGWSDIRKIMEDKVGHKLSFGEAPITTLICGEAPGKPPANTKVEVPLAIVVSTSTVEDSAKRAAAVTNTNVLAVEAYDGKKEDLIPPFDPSIMANSLYGEFVEVATRGTNLVPQFVYSIAKNIVATKLSGNMKFETVDAEPRQYLTNIGSTGTGKGEAWRRTFAILTARKSTDYSTTGDNLFDEADSSAQVGMINRVCGIKVIDSFDSSAGLKDAFFAAPESAPILCYIDEVIGFGNKGKDTKNPDILDVFVELADSTTISRVVAKRGGEGGTKTKTDARLSAVICAQDGDSIAKAFSTRAKMGLYDRLIPEFAQPVDDPGNLPAVDLEGAIALFVKISLLKCSGTMTITSDANDFINTYWSNLLPQVRKKARLKKNLSLDAYLVAFGRGSMVVEVSDVEIAIKTFMRQIIIRHAFFNVDASDRIGYYLQKIKGITENMKQREDAGEAQTKIALARRDYERLTHAHRDNETHIFERAWRVHQPHWLKEVTVIKANGQRYVKYLPMPEDPDPSSD